MEKIKCELYRDSFQNYKTYNIPKAQLVIADIPYNISKNAYGSNPMWYVGGTILMERAILLTNNSSIVMITLE